MRQIINYYLIVGRKKNFSVWSMKLDSSLGRSTDATTNYMLENVVWFETSKWSFSIGYYLIQVFSNTNFVEIFCKVCFDEFINLSVYGKTRVFQFSNMNYNKVFEVFLVKFTKIQHIVQVGCGIMKFFHVRKTDLMHLWFFFI